MLNKKIAFTRDQVLDALEYLHLVRNNNKGRRLQRTSSIIKELKQQGKKFSWSGFNTIYLEPSENYNLKIYIQGDIDCYRCRYDLILNNNHHFTVKEIEANNGNQLLWELVCNEWLDRSYLPMLKWPNTNLSMKHSF